MSRRVVITGLGAITSLGNDVSSTWNSILFGKSGITQIDYFNTEKMTCKIGSSVKNFSFESIISARDLKKMDKFIKFGLVAADEAIKGSGWTPVTDRQKERTGVIVGSGIGGLGTIETTSVELDKSERARVSPYFIPASLINLLPGHISINYGYQGPNSAVCTACSTGAHAIGDAARVIKYGDADVMIAGGAEAPITPIGVTGFASMKALCSTFNDSPEQASRPWDAKRDGFVMGEGAGVVVLEEYEHAKKRGAKIYAEVLGYGMSADASHITAPSGSGATRAMQMALKDANVSSEDIDYINAHGTSTPLGDKIELDAVQTLFSNNDKLKMSSTKSSIGHLLGAAGSVEIIFTALSIRDSIVPATLNLHEPLENVKINLVPLKSQETKVRYAMSNSFGFGGTNASIVLGKC
ncbi:MAG TPA: beta-ketoacyl-ACP synthase II [Candidatus Megaira endosymbiont of Nemacystus decipiens]|nr:beta-ketoacyl-ACP synthase II [Candidatus Megaera endosymbiont of Nemacystus decipiens]